MAIKYSIAKRTNFVDGSTKVYPTTQLSSRMDLNEFSKHIAQHGSPYTRDTIVGVLTAMVDCLREKLLDGVKVTLGDLGSFSCSCKSKGTDTAEEFSAKDITSVNVTWQKGNPFKNIIDDAEFEYVTTREAQEEAKKARKDELDNGSTADQDTEPGEETGGSGSGGDDDEPGGG